MVSTVNPEGTSAITAAFNEFMSRSFVKHQWVEFMQRLEDSGDTDLRDLARKLESARQERSSIDAAQLRT